MRFSFIHELGHFEGKLCPSWGHLESVFACKGKKRNYGTQENHSDQASSGLSSTQFDHSRFVSAKAEAHFQASITNRSGIKERGFELDSENSRTGEFSQTIPERGWQLFVRHPKAAAMTVVHKFFANAPKGPTGHKVFV